MQPKELRLLRRHRGPERTHPREGTAQVWGVERLILYRIEIDQKTLSHKAAQRPLRCSFSLL